MLKHVYSLKTIYLFLSLIPLLCLASTQEKNALTPRTMHILEDEKQNIRSILITLRAAYIKEKDNYNLIETNPRAWLLKQNQQALKTCSFMERVKRIEHIEEEKRSRTRLQNLFNDKIN